MNAIYHHRRLVAVLRSAATARDDAIDLGLAVGLFGSQAVVRAATHADVLGVVAAALAARIDVVVLEPGSTFTTGAVGGLPGAAQAVSLEDRAAHRIG